MCADSGSAPLLERLGARHATAAAAPSRDLAVPVAFSEFASRLLRGVRSESAQDLQLAPSVDHAALP